jgi:hypothetical protein
MERLAQIVDLSSTETNTISKRIEMRKHDPRDQGVPSGCVQNGFWSYGMFGANYRSTMHQY